ncbi:MAG: hypothetical protein KJO69_04000 [Gammaproteobacteria bacterium]|nr:hypothetical protein [Gammaproteobacteria bacterium]
MSNEKVTKLGRLPEGALDEYYIDAYLETPYKKSEAYRSAVQRYYKDCEDQNIDPHRVNLQYAGQYAKKIHERLRERIQAELYKMAEDDKAFGRSVLRQLAKEAESESVKAQCASNLAKGLYPDHQVVRTETIEDIDQELKQLEREIESAGAKVH